MGIPISAGVTLRAKTPSGLFSVKSRMGPRSGTLMIKPIDIAKMKVAVCNAMMVSVGIVYRVLAPYRYPISERPERPAVTAASAVVRVRARELRARDDKM